MSFEDLSIVGRATSFESQFAHTEQFETVGGTAEVVDIRPEENLDTDVPVFLAPAWASTLEIYKPALRTITEQKRRAISLNHPRFGGDMSDTAEEMLEKYPEEELRKALTILDILDQKGIDKIDVIAHSEGAINTAIAASIHPEKFRSIVFVAPAGMIGEDTFTRLAEGFRSQSSKTETTTRMPFTEAQREVAQVYIKEILAYLKNPIRSVKEGMDISKSQIHDMLRYLHEKGIGIVVLSGVDDPVFPMNKMQEIAKADMLDGFLSLRGGHGELGVRPELFVTAATDMLAKLEVKKQKDAERTG